MTATTAEDLERTATTATNVWLSGYDLLGVLGAGAFGTVFKALQHKFDRTVAIKVITIDDETNPTVAVRFETEAITHGKLHHPNIVQVYDRGHQGERLFIVMELLDGEDLGHRVKKGGPLPEHVAWAIARQTASALAHAYKQGVVHRDIKPANLFLVAGPSGLGLPRDVPLVKVTDFGLALTKQAATESNERLTADGVILGTPIYMAPEQFRHAPDLDHRADIYSLGATVAHIVSGHAPFAGPTVWDVMTQKLGNSPKIASTVSAESRTLIAEMMATDPAQRPASYEALISRIDSLLKFQPSPIEPVAAVAPRRIRWTQVVGLGTILAVVIAAPLFFPPARAVTTPRAEVFATNGQHYFLFDGATLAGWLPPASGGAWKVTEDDEGDAILTGTGFLRHSFTTCDHYRLTLGLDVYDAAAAEVFFALPAALPEQGERLVLRVTKAAGAVLGKRRGDKGTFEALSEAVPFPPASKFDEGKPYLEVRLERAAGQWTASFNGTVVGSVADDVTEKSPEVRLHSEGGRARVNSVVLTPLQRE